MKQKYLLSLLVAAVSAGSACAQSSIFNSGDNKPYLGVRGSFEMSCPTSNASGAFTNGAGFSLGGVYNIPLYANLYVEPGFNIFYNTWSAKNLDIIGGVAENSFRNWGLAIPVMVGYHFDFTSDLNVAVFTGPELRVGLANNYHYSLLDDKITGNFDLYKKDGVMHRVDCAWRIGAALNYEQIYLGISGGIGMVNLKNNPSNPSMYQNTVDVTIGYNF